MVDAKVSCQQDNKDHSALCPSGRRVLNRGQKSCFWERHQAKALCPKTAVGQLDFGDLHTEDGEVAGVELEETGRRGCLWHKDLCHLGQLYLTWTHTNFHRWLREQP